MKRSFLHCTILASLALLPVHAADAPATQPAEQTTASGLKIITVKAVDQALTAQNGDQVWVHYSGKLESGKKFDSSFDHEKDRQGDATPIKFHLGEGNVIKGWDEGIVGMKVGEKRQLIIPASLAYGAQGTPDGAIPPGATLSFDVELVGIYRPSK